MLSVFIVISITHMPWTTEKDVFFGWMRMGKIFLMIWERGEKTESLVLLLLLKSDSLHFSAWRKWREKKMPLIELTLCEYFSCFTSKPFQHNHCRHIAPHRMNGRQQKKSIFSDCINCWHAITTHNITTVKDFGACYHNWICCAGWRGVIKHSFLSLFIFFFLLRRLIYNSQFTASVCST